MRPGSLGIAATIGAVVSALGPWGALQPRAISIARNGAAPVEIKLAAGGDLEGAILAARPGDTISLEAGATFRGPFRLPIKDGDGWITIDSSALSQLPAGVRVDRSQSRLMPKLVSAARSVVTADPGAHHYRFSGIEIAPAAGSFLVNVVDLGTGMSSLTETPHDFVFDRCYVHGDPVKGSRRGLALNSMRTTVSDSYFSDFKQLGADSQAIAGWNGPGPFEITNNYLEGAGENILFGGADPSIEGLVPSDITVTRNHLAKPLSWRQGDAAYGGTPWSVKNLFELKNARRVTIDSNLFEFNWPQSQNGFAILFTVRNQDGHSPWSVVEDVAFTNNVVRHVSAGINILGHDDVQKSGAAQRILIKNNLLTDVGFGWTFGRLFQLLNGADQVTIEHNTAIHSDTPLFAGDNTPHQHFVFENNIIEQNAYGIIGSGTAPGDATIEKYFPGGLIQGNVLVNGANTRYPKGNFFPSSLDAVGFVAPAQGDYQLSASSAFAGRATDGGDPGVDMHALNTVFAAATVASTGRGAPLVLLVMFWGALAVLAYAYVGYGMLASCWARLRARPARRDLHRPTVSIVVAAFNEGARIEARLANLLSLEYPADCLEVVVASDGSTDDTVARASQFPRVRVIAFGARRGKASVLDDVVPRLRGEIVVFADARQTFDVGAIAALVNCFADETVGAASGELMIQPHGTAESAASGAAMYWSFEKRIRRWESLIDSSVGATGAIYAIRRELFEPIAADTLLDDVVIPMRIARKGWRVVFEPTALAFDCVSASARQEYTRKVRTIAGTFQLFARERWLFSPSQNRLWLQTLSHKGLRLLLPCLYAILLVSNILLASAPLYQWLLACQMLFYASAVAGYLWPGRAGVLRLLVVPYTICFLTWTTIVGFARYLTGAQQVTWDTTNVRPT